MTTREIWRAIPSMPTHVASSEGRLMVIPHQKPMPHGGLRTYGGTAVRGSWVAKEQRYITVIRGRTHKVARLVAEAFHGSAPFPRAVVMHLDEDASNNRPENLQWGTQKENLNAPGFLAYCRARTGDDNPFIKGRRKEVEDDSYSVD